jgi:uncharacterized coiled-coil protein SlyX|tara:strand:- start:204 stop:416 length:213 start_codon:yes stop_codon:yes gene_type:complete
MNFSLEYCLSLEEKIETLEKRCDMQQEIIDDVNFLLRYYMNNVERKMKDHEQFVKSCEDIGEKEQAIIDV